MIHFRKQPQKTSTARRLVVPAATAVGAVVMYLFDPKDGRRRRAVAKDKTTSKLRRVRRRVEQRGRYIEGKAQGISHAVRPHAVTPPPNDATIKHKIESEVLRHYETGAINVNVDKGVAQIRGQVRHPEDVRRIEQDVARVPGVVEVNSFVHTPGRT